MRVITSDAYGSFTAWGRGIFYEYHSDSKCLTIIHARRHERLVDIDMRESTPEFVQDFVETFERAIQIQALMLSNHTTVDLTEIFSEKRLRSYFSNSLHVCGLIMHARRDNFEAFQKIFCEQHAFSSLHISKMQYRASDTPFYKLSLKTEKGNRVETQGFYIHNCFSSLASLVISDLIFLETQNNFQEAAHNLLAASSKLSILSLVLDYSFVPERRIVKKDDGEKPRYA